MFKALDRTQFSISHKFMAHLLLTALMLMLAISQIGVLPVLGPDNIQSSPSPCLKRPIDYD
ncbi:MAG: hypothetical protein WCR46_02800 [Deltaproteobacteria bacterium]